MNNQWKVVPVELLKKCRVLAAMQNEQPTRHLIELDAILNAPVPPAGDVEVLLDGVLDEMSRRFELSKRDDDHMVYDDTQIGVEFAIEALRPVLTRLTAERDALQLLLNVADQRVCDLTAERDEVESMLGADRSKLSAMETLADNRRADLTKARERNCKLESVLAECRYNFQSHNTETQLVSIIDALLATPIACNVDESCGLSDVLALSADRLERIGQLNKELTSSQERNDKLTAVILEVRSVLSSPDVRARGWEDRCLDLMYAAIPARVVDVSEVDESCGQDAEAAKGGA